VSLDKATQSDIQNTVKDIAQHRDHFAADMLKLKKELQQDPHYKANRAEEMKMLGQELVKQGVLPKLSVDHVVNIGDHGTILTREGNKLEWHNGAGRSGVIAGHERATTHQAPAGELPAAPDRSATGEQTEKPPQEDAPHPAIKVDANNRVIELDYPNNTIVTLPRDASGQIQDATITENGNGRFTYKRNGDHWDEFGADGKATHAVATDIQVKDGELIVVGKHSDGSPLFTKVKTDGNLSFIILRPAKPDA
jgi:hypothetical protein